MIIGGPHPASITDGLASTVAHSRCERCDCSVPTDDLCDVAGERWCTDCSDRHAVVCEHSGDLYPETELDDVIVARPADGHFQCQRWSETARDAHAFWCDITRDWYDNRQFSLVELSDGSHCVDFHFERHGDPTAATTSPLPQPSVRSPEQQATA